MRIIVVCVTLAACGGKGEGTQPGPVNTAPVQPGEPEPAEPTGESDEIKEQKTIEARQFVKKLYDGARAYYMDHPPRGIQPLPAQFPTAKPGITPPLGTCCEEGGRCQPAASYWTADTWIALQFSVDDPHYYSYEYKSADPAKSFTVSAHGDLDCDGVYSTFQMIGEAGPDGPTGNAELFRKDELE